MEELNEKMDIIPVTTPQMVIPGGLPRGILIPKDKVIMPQNGVQVFIDPIDINPWPTEPDEQEPESPMVFHNNVTFTLSKKGNEKAFRAFKRLIRKDKKVPRKLKKALRHIYLPYSKPIVYDPVKKPDGTVCCTGFVSGYQIKPGYPHTKWARKAIRKINRNIKKDIDALINMDNCRIK